MKTASLVFIICATLLASLSLSIVHIPLQKKVHKNRLSPILKSVSSNNLKSGTSVPISNTDYFTYYGPIFLGSNRQYFEVEFDTVLANLWVASSLCRSIACSQKSKFVSANSTSFVANGTKVEFKGGKDKVEAVLGQDQLLISGLNVQGVVFGLATSLSFTYLGKPYSGAFGLGWPSLSQGGAPGIFQLMIQQGLVTEHSFSYFMKSYGTKKTNSYLILGGVDHRFYEGDLAYYNLSDKFLWMFQMDSISIHKKQMNPAPFKAILDSGSGFILGSKEIIDPILHKLGPVVPEDVDCSTKIQFPDLVLKVNGVSYTVPSSSYIIESDDHEGRHCFLAIRKYEFDAKLGPVLLLGDPFLTNYYTHYDVENNRVGLAKAIQDQVTLEDINIVDQ